MIEREDCKMNTLGFSYLDVIRKLFYGFEWYVKDIIKDERKEIWKEATFNYFNYCGVFAPHKNG
jgi:hypothetical protein